ncbi:MAG: metallophosphoesterase [Candidatus Aenigmarchaeota archaeon]|nr:metallophosphoesterase [Candidatus Aenigmarchaeota archaeon]
MESKNIILFVTDLHGDVSVYEELFRLGAGMNVKAIIIGGDITPFMMGTGEENIAIQRDFIKTYLIPRISKFKKDHKKVVFLMFGNDDFKVNYDLLIQAEKKGVLKLLHQGIHKLNDWTLRGYSFVNPTPFFIKDWERKEKDIEKDLKEIENQCAEKSLIVFHAPPINTNLDIIYTGEHVGSKSIRKFIEKAQPTMTLHGHIHESPEISGNTMDKIGETICINPGNAKIILIDLDNPKNIIFTK